MKPAIRVENLSKQFLINHELQGQGYRTFREAITDVVMMPIRQLRAGAALGKTEEFWALQDINFEINPGEVLGIIGRNGAGKSTLLKILSRITDPTAGRVELRGRVGSLLEVGTGFHPELTGRENVFLNGSILGMSRKEISSKFDEIVDFSGVEKFLDTPVKRYSSGMRVRLAFAVAAHLEPEILLIDEVLAVGDVEFQKKCLGKMENIAEGGRTILFVSHNMSAIRSLTTQTILLRGGQLQEIGETADVIETYLSDALREKVKGNGHNLTYFRRDQNTNTPIKFHKIWVTGADGTATEILQRQEDFTVHFDIESADDFAEVFLSFKIVGDHGNEVALIYSGDQREQLRLVKGRQTIACNIQQMPVSPGRYFISVGINNKVRGRSLDAIMEYPLFQAHYDEIDRGELLIPDRKWGAFHWDQVEWSAN